MPQTTVLPTFDGVTCHGLLAQECHYRGEMVEPVNVLFLRVAPDRWLRMYIDCGSFGHTEVSEVEEIAPEDSDPEFRYPIVDLAVRCPIVGRRIIRAELKELPPDGAELALALDDGSVLTLLNCNDTSVVEYRRAAG
jgi:hypothetical protein